MKLELHHINFASDDVNRLDRFYRTVLGLSEAADDLPERERNKGYPGDVSFLSDGKVQMHLAEKDLGIGFRTGHVVNPVDRGHIAFRTDDIAAFKAHLERHDIPYSDFGNLAVNGWHQVFFYDPDGNVVEVHQVEK